MNYSLVSTEVILTSFLPLSQEQEGGRPGVTVLLTTLGSVNRLIYGHRHPPSFRLDNE